MTTYRHDFEKQVFDKIAGNDLAGLKNFMLTENIAPDIYDEFGMTPLQLAAYKGNREIVELLLSLGANVNWEKQGNGYSALHYAALSGKADVCQVLLMAGAKRNAVNSVGCSVSEMAALIDNQACVAAINNFVPIDDLESLTVPHGSTLETPLPTHLVSPLHKFVLAINVHPVRILLNLNRSQLLKSNLDKIYTVLKILRDKEMKKGAHSNEVLALKLHYLAYVVGQLSRWKDKLFSSCHRENDNNYLELFAKRMIKKEPGEPGTSVFQDSFLRECVRQFPYRRCPLFRMLVATLSKPDSPSALNVITATINGRRFLRGGNSVYCSTCDEEGVNKKCSRCRAVYYCDKDCQKLHWAIHKKECNEVLDDMGDNFPSSSESDDDHGLGEKSEEGSRKVKRCQEQKTFSKLN